MKLYPRRPGLHGTGPWTKSSLSSYNGNCVEVAELADGSVLLRNSNDPGGEVLHLSARQWDAMVSDVRRGEFDRQP
jgi:hypothetical protein